MTALGCEWSHLWHCIYEVCSHLKMCNKHIHAFELKNAAALQKVTLNLSLYAQMKTVQELAPITDK